MAQLERELTVESLMESRGRLRHALETIASQPATSTVTPQALAVQALADDEEWTA